MGVGDMGDMEAAEVTTTDIIIIITGKLFFQLKYKAPTNDLPILDMAAADGANKNLYPKKCSAINCKT